MNGERDDRDRALVLQEAARLKAGGRLADAARLLEDELRSRKAANAPADIDLFVELADVFAKQGAWAKANGAIDRGLASMRAGADDSAEVKLLERRAWIAFREGKLGDAFQIADALIREIDEGRHPALLASLYNTLGGVTWQQGRIVEAIAAVGRAAELYERTGDHAGLANARTNLGVLYFNQGLWSKAAQNFADSDRVLLEIGWTTGRASNLLNLGWLEVSLGNHADGRKHLEESLRLSLESGEEYDVGHAEIALAHLDLIEAHIDDAGRHLDSVLQRTHCICDDDVVQASWLKALVACDRGGVDEAIELAERARSIARKSQLIESESDCCRALGIAYARGQNHAEAERLLQEAVDLSGRASDPYRRALALFELGVIYHDAAGRQLRNDDARRDSRQKIEEAAQVFEQLGARHDLQRARMALERAM